MDIILPDKAPIAEAEPIKSVNKNINKGKGKALYTVKVTHPNLRIRKEPSTDGGVVDYITDQGQYEIYAEESGWGQLKNGNWIMLSLTQKVK